MPEVLTSKQHLHRAVAVMSDFLRHKRSMALDLGSQMTKLVTCGTSDCVRIPSLIALRNTQKNQWIEAIGKEALSMMGRSPPGLQVYQPVQRGLVADPAKAEAMLKCMIHATLQQSWYRRGIQILICTPTKAQEIERRTLAEIAQAAGASSVKHISTPLATAIGSGVDIMKAKACMVVDIGAATTDIAVIVLGETIDYLTLDYGGQDFDNLIREWMKENHNARISTTTAENIRQRISSEKRNSLHEHASIPCSSLSTGLPMLKNIRLSGIETTLLPVVDLIAEGIHRVVEKQTPAVIDDILCNRLIIAGGASKTAGVLSRITARLNIPANISKNPTKASTLGAETVAMDRDLMKAITQDAAQ